jgi:hypothetical protein
MQQVRTMEVMMIIETGVVGKDIVGIVNSRQEILMVNMELLEEVVIVLLGHLHLCLELVRVYFNMVSDNLSQEMMHHLYRGFQNSEMGLIQMLMLQIKKQLNK